MTPGFWDIIQNGLAVYDNRETLKFQRELARIDANNNAVLKAAELQQNVNAQTIQSTALQDTLKDAVNTRNIVLLFAAGVLVVVLVRGV